jgi:MFS family permease
VPVLVVTTATQSLSTLGALALAAVAPVAAAELSISAALIGYQVGLVFFGAALSATIAGGLVQRYGAVRASQITLGAIAAGCAVSAFGSVATLVAGALLIGFGYGIPNPAASQLLARLPSQRRMNLLFSIKQTGVPIGGMVSGILIPPLTVAFGWKAALAACALLVAALAVAIGVVRRAWDTDTRPDAPVLGSAIESVALVWRHPPLRWLSAASLLYSGVQLCLTGFLVTYLVGDIGLALVVAGTVLSITHFAGALGRLTWGWLADRLGSGGLALMANGACSALGALVTAAVAPSWPFAAIAIACAAFGFCAMGWNGVYMAVIARQSPPQSIGLATGGSLVFTYAGVVMLPPGFAALHDQLGFSYGSAFALLAVATAIGAGCVWLARASVLRARAA